MSAAAVIVAAPLASNCTVMSCVTDVGLVVSSKVTSKLLVVSEPA